MAKEGYWKSTARQLNLLHMLCLRVKKISVKNNKGMITITASKVKGAAGYAFVVTADSGLTDIVAIKESKKNTVTIKNLSKGHTYYIRACAL